MIWNMIPKTIHILFLSLILLLLFKLTIFAQTTTVDTCKDKGDPQVRADCYLSIIQNLQGQEKTLSSQIAVMDAQINLTQSRIDATKQQISDLTLDIDTATKKVNNLQNSLNDLIKILLNRMVATYEIGQVQPFGILLTSTDASNFFSRLNYLKIAQTHDKQLIYLTQQAKNDYVNQKNIFEDKKKQVETLKIQLESYTQQLNQEKQSKKDLLSQTQGDETVYENLRQQALAQLRSFASFAGGASVLSNQTSCDDWGCYYNQRDSQWANILINGSNDCNGPCSVLRVGCTITSIAMVASHMGHRDILPSDIAQSSPDNFQVGTALIKYNITVKSVNINRGSTNTWNGSTDSQVNSIIDNDLKNGPVIVGMYVSTGTHFVVIKGGSGGNYTMNDPFTENGKDIPFTSHYSISSIFEVDTVSM